MKKNNIKKIFLNFLKNIMAYAMPVAVLQFLIQPMIARNIGDELNGLFLTIIALNYFLTNITASTLLQTRLLLQEKYEQKCIIGDFNLMLLIMGVVNTCLMLGGVIYYSKGRMDYIDMFMCVVLSVLFLIHDYICVQYRVELDFTKILVSNIILCVGYGVGAIVFFYIYPKWQMVFIVAYIICEIYDVGHTTYLKEKMIVTPLMRGTLKKYFTLAGASILSYLVSYGDRILLYPVTDGTTVSIFTSAEIMGKMLMLLGSPLSAFLLSYMVKWDGMDFSVIKKKHYVYAGFFFFFAYTICVILSIPMLRILYPMWAEKSMQYVPLVTMTSMLNLLSMILNVIIVRFCHAKWQVIINGTYLISYLLISFVWLHFAGLRGFCFGNIMASFIKVLFMVFIIYKYSRKNRLIPISNKI